jgi:RNA polymerase subunit RPABC4/transcription elongation factor Spt4/uncharacterized membrane protein YgdD (TMEM256/DUF423 family)
MNTPLVASLLLLFSLCLPWTITCGTNRYGALVEEFRIFEFPFVVYYVTTYDSQSLSPTYEFYQSIPKYLGTALVLAGGILALFGCTKMKRESLVNLGGALSLVGMVFFSGSTYAEIYIPYAIVQEYASYPVGLFIPATFWLLILYRPGENVRRDRGTPFEQREVFCGECGRKIHVGTEICPFCGTATGRTICRKCGMQISTQHVYCPFCGAKRQDKTESLIL